MNLNKTHLLFKQTNFRRVFFFQIYRVGGISVVLSAAVASREEIALEELPSP